MLLGGACGRHGFDEQSGGGPSTNGPADAQNGGVDTSTGDGSQPLDSSTVAGGFTIGGNVSGLAGTLVLRNNGGDNLSVTSNGMFMFATALATGQSYNVTVATQPAGMTCSVANGTGTVASSNITTVSVTCAAVALAQMGSVVEGTGSIVVSLPSTTAGNLLVLTLALNGCSLMPPGGGFVQAAEGLNSTNCAFCWTKIYYVVSTGGAKSVTVGGDVNAPIVGQMTEWSGLAATPLDQTGNATASNGTTFPVSTSAATTVAGDLGVTAFCQAAGGATTYSSGTGWTTLGDSGASAEAIHLVSGYQGGLPIGAVSATATSSQGGKWAGAIVTFHR
jgi:hypothetical protein